MLLICEVGHTEAEVKAIPEIGFREATAVEDRSYTANSVSLATLTEEHNDLPPPCWVGVHPVRAGGDRDGKVELCPSLPDLGFGRQHPVGVTTPNRFGDPSRIRSGVYLSRPHRERLDPEHNVDLIGWGTPSGSDFGVEFSENGVVVRPVPNRVSEVRVPSGEVRTTPGGQTNCRIGPSVPPFKDLRSVAGSVASTASDQRVQPGAFAPSAVGTGADAIANRVDRKHFVVSKS